MRSDTRRTLIGILLFVPLAVVLLATYACLPAPVGDPEQSKVEDKFTGAWQSTDAKNEETNIVLLRPWDKHTYYLTFITQKANDKGAASQLHLKAWLTKLGDGTFLTAEPLDTLEFAFGPAKDEKPVWIVGRVELKGDTITLRLVNEKSAIVKDLDTREKLEAAIKAQVDNAELYNEAKTFKKVTKENAKIVEDALKAPAK